MKLFKDRQDRQKSMMIYLLLVSSIVGLAKRTPQSRIIGGYEVRPNSKYPWVVSLALMGSHQCGGMALRHNVILTAAHCTIFDDEDWSVRFRHYDFSQDPSNEFAVAERRPHPHYNSKEFDLNDIALWKIQGSFDLDQYIKFDTNSISYSEGHILKVVGWGSVKQGGGVHSKLMETELPIFDIRTCIKALAAKGKVVNPQAMFCAGFPEGGRDACQGDSGGPVFTLHNSLPIMVGIVSWGYGCALPGFPAIFTRLDAYSHFINSPF